MSVSFDFEQLRNQLSPETLEKLRKLQEERTQYQSSAATFVAATADELRARTNLRSHLSLTSSPPNAQEQQAHTDGNSQPVNGKRRQGQESTAAKPRPKRIKKMSVYGKKVNQPKGKTRLRTDHSVRAEIPLEVWTTVLSYCPPKFLRTAWRINKDVCRVLSTQSNVWKMARKEFFGYDMPDPPQSLGERRYNTLLFGSRCMKCKQRKTTQTYWCFPARYCLSCFKAETMMVDAWRHAVNGDNPFVETTIGSRVIAANGMKALQNAVPHAIFRGSTYKGSVVSCDQFLQRRTRPLVRYYPLEAAKKFRNDYYEFIGVTADDLRRMTERPVQLHVMFGNKSEPETRAWATEQRALFTRDFEPFAAIEDFILKYRENHREDLRLWKEQRVDFFKLKASQLDPPMSEAELRTFHCYHTSIVIGRKPSELVWNELYKRILKEKETPMHLRMPMRVIHKRSYYNSVQLTMDGADDGWPSMSSMYMGSLASTDTEHSGMHNNFDHSDTALDSFWDSSSSVSPIAPPLHASVSSLPPFSSLPPPPLAGPTNFFSGIPSASTSVSSMSVLAVSNLITPTVNTPPRTIQAEQQPLFTTSAFSPSVPTRNSAQVMQEDEESTLRIPTGLTSNLTIANTYSKVQANGKLEELEDEEEEDKEDVKVAEAKVERKTDVKEPFTAAGSVPTLDAKPLPKQRQWSPAESEDCGKPVLEKKEEEDLSTDVKPYQTLNGLRLK